MLADFDAMPRIDGPDGSTHDLGTREGRAAIRDGWLKAKWAGQGLWPEGASPADELRRKIGAFYSEKYARIAAGGPA
jgi:hypothetical protein